MHAQDGHPPIGSRHERELWDQIRSQALRDDCATTGPWHYGNRDESSPADDPTRLTEPARSARPTSINIAPASVAN
jgi:hypothetical protein